LIKEGRAIIEGAPQQLSRSIREPALLRIGFASAPTSLIPKLRKLPLIREVNFSESSSVLDIRLEDVERDTPEVIRFIASEGGNILNANIMWPTLEETYLKMLEET
jgi:hypothetical protein